MPSISQRLYNEIMMADDFTCVYCGVRTPDITIDHFIPQSQNGPDVLANLLACCLSCNMSKGDRPIHVAGMALLYGRFRQAQIPLRSIAQTTTEQALERVSALATQVDEAGAYCYSANEIARTVRGDRNTVLATIRALRDVPPVPEFRQENGETTPASYPVTGQRATR